MTLGLMMTTVPVMTPSSRAPILGTVCGWAPREPPFINAKPKPEGASRGLRIQAEDQEGAGGRLQNGGVGSRRILHETASGHAWNFRRGPVGSPGPGPAASPSSSVGPGVRALMLPLARPRSALAATPWRAECHLPAVAKA